MRALRHPPQYVLGAEDGNQPGRQRPVDGGDEHHAAGSDQLTAGRHESIQVRDMFDNFHVEHHVIGTPLRRQALRRRQVVANGQAGFGRMRLGYPQVSLDHVNAMDLCAQAGHGLRQDATATTDVEDPDTGQGKRVAGIQVQVPTYLRGDEWHPNRVQAMQRPERPLFVPPGLCKARVVRGLARIDALARHGLCMGTHGAPPAARVATMGIAGHGA